MIWNVVKPLLIQDHDVVPVSSLVYVPAVSSEETVNIELVLPCDRLTGYAVLIGDDA
jgi:predicted carbohydrate-binding protein with CBM5 and CBM33 domain